jgi:enolase
MKRSSDAKFAYSVEGVGLAPSCQVQIVADNCYATVDDLKALNDEAVYNTVKIQLRRCRTVSAAVTLCACARNYGWSIIIGCEENFGETSENFLADFAVGVGAGQICLGGLHSGESSSKLNRLFEIQAEDDSIGFAGRKFR